MRLDPLPNVGEEMVELGKGMDEKKTKREKDKEIKRKISIDFATFTVHNSYARMFQAGI